jgi:hypothetical protein
MQRNKANSLTKHNIVKIPEFKTRQEEIEYWDEQDRLAEAAGHKLKIHNPKPGEEHHSYFSFELKDLDIDRLYEIAQERKMELDEFIRQMLAEAIKKYDSSKIQEIKRTRNKPNLKSKAEKESVVVKEGRTKYKTKVKKQGV